MKARPEAAIAKAMERQENTHQKLEDAFDRISKGKAIDVDVRRRFRKFGTVSYSMVADEAGADNPASEPNTKGKTYGVDRGWTENPAHADIKARVDNFNKAQADLKAKGMLKPDVVASLKQRNRELRDLLDQVGKEKEALAQQNNLLREAAVVLQERVDELEAIVREQTEDLSKLGSGKVHHLHPRQ